jgi:2-phospho-L-lactate/phosphoenolpyruvate guanylyltransferase
MILIPVKNLSSAKQRLASLLDQATRTELAQAMLLDVAETLASWVGRPEVALVTSDPFACDLARRFGFDVIHDSLNRSETDAIELATRICESRQEDFTLVIPGDVPSIQVAELEKILESMQNEGSVLSPAADGRGTNAAFRRPAGLFPLRFGNNSFKPHLAAARATGKPLVVLPLPGVALDVDRPADLRRLADLPGETHSQRMVRGFDLADLPRAASE